jgi:Mg2+ and Co2+ transporter CorA
VQVVEVTAEGIEPVSEDRWAAMLDAGGYDGPGFLWVDGEAAEPQISAALNRVAHVHPEVQRRCTDRNFVPKASAYADHVLVVLHSPDLGAGGHVHHLELDLVIRDSLLVTVHGPLNPKVDRALSFHETEAVRLRLQRGRYRPSRPFEVAYAVIAELLRSQGRLVERLAGVVGRLEVRVSEESDLSEPVAYLTELFAVRQALLSLRTMARLTAETLAGASGAAGNAPPEAQRLVDGLCAEATRIGMVAEGEMESIQGVTELYQSTTSTKMAVASERLAVVAAFTLPITALASVYGMNLIVNQRTQVVHLALVLTVMAGLALGILGWARRRHWL